jgi:Excalibur calcium-binding domain
MCLCWLALGAIRRIAGHNCNMFKRQTIVFVFAAICMHHALVAATPVYKCISNGAIAFQSDPCPSNTRRKEPNINQLNAERMKKRLEDGNSTKSENVATDGQLSPKPDVTSVPLNSVEKNQSKQTVTPASAPVSSFRCDGRKYCSQMTSCSEAKFFLNNCPGVKMDGSRGGSGSGNGIPCERQWCNSPLD